MYQNQPQHFIKPIQIPMASGVFTGTHTDLFGRLLLSVGIVFAIGVSWTSAEENGRRDKAKVESPSIHNLPRGALPGATTSSTVVLPTYGIAKPRALATLRFTIGGQLFAIDCQEGDWVEAGQPLARAQDQVARVNLEMAKQEASHTAARDAARSAWQLAEGQHDRFREVMAREAGSAFELSEKRSILEQAKAALDREVERVEAAKLRVSLADAELNKYRLIAPFAGQVVQIHHKVGNSFDPSIDIITIADLSELEVEMHLPILMYGEVSVGQSIRLILGAPVEREVEGYVVYAANVINAPSHSFRCVMRIANQDRQFPGGVCVYLAP